MLSVGAPSPSPDCLAAVEDCVSNLCKSQQAIYSAVCGGEDNVHTLYLVLGTGDAAQSYWWNYKSNDCIFFGGSGHKAIQFDYTWVLHASNAITEARAWSKAYVSDKES